METTITQLYRHLSLKLESDHNHFIEANNLTNRVQLGSIDMGTEAAVPGTTPSTKATPIAPPETTTIPVPDANADTGKDKTGEQDKSKMVQMPQSDLDRLMADRAGQAKRNALSDLLKDLDVSDVTALKTIAESHKQAEEVRIAAEEAQKTELQKSTDLLTASTAMQSTQGQAIIELLIKVAVMERAPAKEVQAVYFADLLQLMDKSVIEITDGVVNVETVDAAIDATLEGRDYLKAQATNNRTPGSPPSKKMLPQQQTSQKQPVIRRGNKPSM